MRLHRPAPLAAGLLLALLPACQGPLHDVAATPQRPTVSSDTNLTATGTLELESGVAFEADERYDLPNTLKLGLTEASEVFISFSPQASTEVPGPNPRGAGDVVVGTRLRAYEDDTWSSAFQFATRLPGGNAGESENRGEADFFGAAIVGTDWGEVGLTGFYQLGLIGDANDESMLAEHTLAAAAGTAIREDIAVFGEFAGIFRPDIDTNALLATVGAQWAWAPSLVWDAALQVGLSDDAPDYQLLVGLTWNLGGIRPHTQGLPPAEQP